ncbi:50S ribosomal protein L6 [Clostridia bacterium]|nr:50S ribosomal protein L6 [Clostridia bacterium]
MSRIGNAPIAVPAGVEVKIDENYVSVKGPKGTLEDTFNQDMKIDLTDGVITVARPSDKKEHRALHGLTRALINNMVIGVTQGFEKNLEMVGVGYKAQMQGKKLVINAGYSHPVEMDPGDDLQVEVPAPTKISIKGISKAKVGAFAANVRAVRPPEPYKGKGIKYAGEYVRRKVGKTGA